MAQVEIREFKSKRLVEIVHSESIAFDRCILLYKQSGERMSFYYQVR